MVRQDQLVWVFTLFISLTVHASLFLNTGSFAGKEHNQAKQPVASTRISFKAYKSETKRSIDSKNPVVKPKPKPKPKAKQKIMQKAKQQRQETKTEVEEKIQAQKANSTTSVDAGTIAMEREHYLNKLMTHIESHKFYPHTARRRGIVGQVEVSLQLSSTGGIKRINCRGKNNLLCEAARKAVFDARPLPLPQHASFPLDFKYKMDFSLR